MKKLLLLAVVLAVLCPMLAMAGDDPMPKLPDYTKAPFAKVADLGYATLDGHEDWGLLSVVLYATADKPGPGVQMVIVASDKEGNLKYAEWHQTREDSYLVYSFIRKNDKWVFEKVTHPQTTPPKSDDNKQKS